MPEGEWPGMKVTRIPWDPFGYDFHGVDYIMSMLLELPDMYMLVPSGQIAFIYIIGRGVVPFRRDWSKLTQEQMDRMVYLIRRDLTIN